MRSIKSFILHTNRKETLVKYVILKYSYSIIIEEESFYGYGISGEKPTGLPAGVVSANDHKITYWLKILTG